LVLLTEGAGKARVGRLRVRQIAALERLADSPEILSAIGSLKGLPILIGTGLAKRNQSIDVGLGGS
jgi:hypothetical protein